MQFNRWLTYRDKQFYSTRLAQELCLSAEKCGDLNNDPHVLLPEWQSCLEESG